MSSDNCACCVDKSWILSYLTRPKLAPSCASEALNEVYYSGTTTQRGGEIAYGFITDLFKAKLMSLCSVSLSGVNVPHCMLLTLVSLFHFCSHLGIVQTHVLTILLHYKAYTIEK